MNQQGKTRILRAIAKDNDIPITELPMASADSLTRHYKHVLATKPKPINGNILIKQQMNVIIDAARYAIEDAEDDPQALWNSPGPWIKEVEAAIASITKFMEEL